MISPTQLLIQHLKMAPAGTALAPEAGRCAMCGGTYEVNDVVEPFVLPDSFTEFSDLQFPSGAYHCGACETTWRKDFMQTYTKSVVCSDGLYPFFSNDAVTYWLLNPPPPPYLMFISTQQLGHIVWKVPVNYSREVMFVRYNDKVLKIRRAHLLKCMEAAHYLSDCLVAAEKEKPGKRKGAAPAFINPMILDRSLEKANHGSIKASARALAEANPTAAEAIAVLSQATVGETWAMVHTLYAKDPIRPERKLAPGDLV